MSKMLKSKYLIIPASIDDGIACQICTNLFDSVWKLIHTCRGAERRGARRQEWRPRWRNARPERDAWVGPHEPAPWSVCGTRGGAWTASRTAPTVQGWAVLGGSEPPAEQNAPRSEARDPRSTRTHPASTRGCLPKAPTAGTPRTAEPWNHQ